MGVHTRDVRLWYVRLEMWGNTRANNLLFTDELCGDGDSVEMGDRSRVCEFPSRSAEKGCPVKSVENASDLVGACERGCKYI